MKYEMFQPRADDPENWDQQTAFFNSTNAGVTFLLGGNGAGCLGAEQRVYDPVAMTLRRVSEIDSPFHVVARDEAGKTVIALATKPRIYGVEDLYAVTLASGATIVVTLGHRVLTMDGWKEIGDIAHDAGLLQFRPLDDVSRCRGESDAGIPNVSHIPTVPQSARVTVRQNATISKDHQATQTPDRTSPSVQVAPVDYLPAGHATAALCEFPKCDARSSHTPSGLMDHCLTDHHPCDVQPRSALGIDLDASQQSVDAHERIRLTLPSGDLADRPTCNHACQCGDHHSTIRCVPLGPRGYEGGCASSELCSRSFGAVDIRHSSCHASTAAIHPTRDGWQFPVDTCRIDTTQSSAVVATASRLDETFTDHSTATECNTPYITAIRFLRRDSYWDFSVESHENYWMEGCWHHNTTETALGKVARFVLHQQPPPREDTPFWIIAGSYEQVMKACWKEKLYGHGRIPKSEVDWSRIRWYREKDGLPYTVPLKPWPGRPGKSWTLCFKSYEQGRQQMQAESIGGFLFVEQFPWGLLEEVLRGCREYDFVGNKLAEFTPIDPLLSEPLEIMMEEDTLPEDWGVFYANTECALKAGHVTQQWFNTFFGMVSPEMRATRMRGAFGGYEGLIYQRFSPVIHIIDDEQADEEMVPGVTHTRGIDWGAGPENPFGCVWGYRTGVGVQTIYDEYYSNDQNFTTHDHLKAVCDQWGWPRQHPSYGDTFADPSDPGNIRLAAKFSRYCPGYEDFNITPARNAVHEGIEHVQYMLAKHPVIGRPLLRISRRCKNLIRELKAYRWEQSSDRGLNPRDARPVPLKKNDHLCDAMRYLLFSQADRLGHTATSFAVKPDGKRHGVQFNRTQRRGR